MTTPDGTPPAAAGSARVALPGRRRWLTRANAITLSRLVTAPVLAVAVAVDAAGAAALLLAFAVASDFADGAVARRYGEASPQGGFLDHATDATLCVLGLAAHAARGAVPWGLPALVAAAFVQYALDSRVLAGRPLRASSLGRVNGIAYYVLVAVPVVRDALALGWPGAAATRLVGWLLVATTLASMLDRALAASRTARGSRGAGTTARSTR
jgi:phosphatidylglycerophosphate synthase